MPDEPNIAEPLLLTTDAAGALLGMSGKALRRADQAEKVPRPVRIGRNVRWRAAELVAWINAGCPNREMWEAMQNGRWRRGAG
jgi:predicted DNA-binding transcriptional regulator AlpA